MKVLLDTSYTISDITILCIQIIALNIFTGKKAKPKRGLKKQLCKRE